MELSKQEKLIVEMMREVKPYEEIKIQKDKGGKEGTYFITRTQKILIDENMNN